MTSRAELQRLVDCQAMDRKLWFPGLTPKSTYREIDAAVNHIQEGLRLLAEAVESLALSNSEIAAEELARLFHDTYERLAPKFVYETREASAVPWIAVPESNRKLMTAVAAEVLRHGTLK